MADLRALLGDKYDETIEKAVEALYDECGRPLSCSKHGHMDEAVSALAAVLPGTPVAFNHQPGPGAHPTGREPGRSNTIDTIRRFGLTKATLILLGLRTDCCGAKLYSPFGWARGYCESCDRRVW